MAAGTLLISGADGSLAAWAPVPSGLLGRKRAAVGPHAWSGTGQPGTARRLEFAEGQAAGAGAGGDSSGIPGSAGSAASGGGTDSKKPLTVVHPGTVHIHKLEPFTAYQFRVIAHNAAGPSLPSEPSSLMLTAAPGSTALAPQPTALATSASSYSLSWTSAEAHQRCRPELRWRVTVHRVATHGILGAATPADAARNGGHADVTAVLAAFAR